jgi:3-hydroxyacyl-[acyl-carrier-protein] dehydratase
MSVALSPRKLLERIPQQEPFRFIDEIIAVDSDHIEAAYTWRPDADFYRGHFPGRPVTPGVLLIESMAQAGVVALGIYLLAQQGSVDDLEKLVTVFTDAQVDFSGMVMPGQRVLVTGRKLFFRRRKLRSEVEMRLEDGTLVCSGVLSGMGVDR